MSLQIITIEGVRGRLNAKGNPEINLEDAAFGLKIVKRDIKNGIEYERIHTQNLKRWLFEFGLIKSENDPLPEFVPNPPR